MYYSYMDKEEKPKWLSIVGSLAVLLAIFLGATLSSVNAEKVELQDQVTSLELENNDLQLAIDEANSNIEDVNSSISDAQGVVGSSYEDMAVALESLETANTVEY